MFSRHFYVASPARVPLFLSLVPFHKSTMRPLLQRKLHFLLHLHLKFQYVRHLLKVRTGLKFILVDIGYDVAEMI